MEPKTLTMQWLDSRDPESFAQEHIKGAINVPLSPYFHTWVELFFDFSMPMTIVINNRDAMSEINFQLKRAGYEQAPIYIMWGTNITQERESSPSVSVQEAAKNTSKWTILDVRSEEEWDEDHLPAARHVNIMQLMDKLKEIPRDQPLRTICASGFRSAIAASILQAAGFKDVSNIRGGMKAWRKEVGGQ